MPASDRSDFLRDLKSAFPGLGPMLNAESGQLHFEMDAFRKFAQRAIFDGEETTVAKCFELAGRYYTEGNSKLREAIDVSFVEGLEFITPRKKHEWAWVLLPQCLKDAYVSFHGRAAV